MISSQIRKEFTAPHYEQVKKVVSTALSGNLSAEDKISMLESEYNMEMASEMEVKDMCNYSEYIEKLGIKKGRAELEPVLEKKDAEIKEKDAEIKQKDAEIEAKDAEIEAKDAVIGAKDIKLATMRALLIANNIPFVQSE